MKKVEAIIRPGKLEVLHNELQEAGFVAITVTEVRGYGRQKGHKEIYRGSEYYFEFVQKIKVELICSDELVEKATEIIIEQSKTGKIGDGRIFIIPVENAIRIRTEESGEEAI